MSLQYHGLIRKSTSIDRSYIPGTTVSFLIILPHFFWNIPNLKYRNRIDSIILFNCWCDKNKRIPRCPTIIHSIHIGSNQTKQLDRFNNNNDNKRFYIQSNPNIAVRWRLLASRVLHVAGQRWCFFSFFWCFFYYYSCFVSNRIRIQYKLSII